MFDIDKSKAINSMLFVLNQLGAEKSDANKVFKILYFAEQKHLVNYGRPNKGDFLEMYQKAMKKKVLSIKQTNIS